MRQILISLLGNYYFLLTNCQIIFTYGFLGRGRIFRLIRQREVLTDNCGSKPSINYTI